MFETITSQSTQEENETLIAQFAEGVTFGNSSYLLKHLPALEQKVEEEMLLPYDKLIWAVELYYSGKYLESEVTFSYLFDLPWKLDSLIGFMQVIRGGNLRSLGQIDRGTQFLNSGLKLLCTSKLLKVYGVYGNYQLGEIYVTLEEFKKAEDYFLIALEINKIAQHSSAKYRIVAGLGSMYLKMGDLEVAFEYLTEAQVLAKGQPRNESNAYHDLGEYYYQRGNCKRAIEMSERAITIRRKTGLNDAATSSSLLKAKTLLLQNKPQQGIDLLKGTLEELRSISAQEKEKNCLFLLSKAYEMLEEYKEAFTYIKLYDKIQTESFYKQRKHILQQKSDYIEEQRSKLEYQHREITASINYSRHLQNAILPPKELIKEYFPNSFVYYQPKDIVAGDFYWLNTPDMRLSNCGFDEIVLIAAADCTGHGVPGAIVSFICSDILNRAVENLCELNPAKILDESMKLLKKRFQISSKTISDGMDISLATFNTNTLELYWAGANNPLYYTQGEELIKISGNKQSIGYTENPKPFTSHYLQLKKGDRFFLGTDGFPDQFGGPKGKKMGSKQYRNLLDLNREKPIQGKEDELKKAYRVWTTEKEEQLDDICIIGIEIK